MLPFDSEEAQGSVALLSPEFLKVEISFRSFTSETQFQRNFTLQTRQPRVLAYLFSEFFK
jgi:hypothetical protein